jgi:uncharacterized Zn finger protein
MVECPRCENEEHVKYVSKFLNGFYVEIQCICGNCGNVFREAIDAEGW